MTDATTPSRRRELARRYAELAETAHAWADAQELGPPTASTRHPRERLLRAVEAADAEAQSGDLAPATRRLETLVPDILARAKADGVDLVESAQGAPAAVHHHPAGSRSLLFWQKVASQQRAYSEHLEVIR